MLYCRYNVDLSIYIYIEMVYVFTNNRNKIEIGPSACRLKKLVLVHVVVNFLPFNFVCFTKIINITLNNKRMFMK